MLSNGIGIQTVSWCVVLSDRQQFVKLALSCAGTEIKRYSIHMQMWHNEAMSIMLRGENRHCLPNSALSYSVFLSGRVRWRASWRHWGSSRKSSTLKASAWTAPSEHTWSQLVAQPALGSGRWRHSGPGDWRSTRPCSSPEHRRAPCWRRSGLTSTLTIRCFM